MPRLFAAVTGAVALAAVIAAHADTGCSVSLPKLAVAEATTATPPEFAALLGTWSDGKWDGTLCTALVVEKIYASGRKATVVYAWGKAPSWTYPVDHPGNVRLEAELTPNGEIVFFSMRSGAKFTFRLEGETLKGVWELKGDKYTVSLRRS